MKIKKFNFTKDYRLSWITFYPTNGYIPSNKERERQREGRGRPSIVENRGVWPCFEFEEKKGIKVEGLRMA